MTNVYREARVAARMTQPHLAQAAGVSVSTVRRMEKDVAVGFESMRSVGAVLGVDISGQPPTAPVRRMSEEGPGGSPIGTLTWIGACLWFAGAWLIGLSSGLDPLVIWHGAMGMTTLLALAVFGPAVLWTGLMLALAGLSAGVSLTMAGLLLPSNFDAVVLPGLAMDAYVTFRMFGISGAVRRCPTKTA